jgi:hypothetical protein
MTADGPGGIVGGGKDDKAGDIPPNETVEMKMRKCQGANFFKFFLNYSTPVDGLC